MKPSIDRGDVKLAYDRAVAHDVPDVADMLLAFAEYIDSLEAELAALKQQEPVGEWVKSGHGNYPALRWAEGYVATVGHKLYLAPQPIQPTEDARDANGEVLGMKPHVFRELINELRDTAIKYHDHQSLRERLSGVIRAVMRKGGA